MDEDMTVEAIQKQLKETEDAMKEERKLLLSGKSPILFYEGEDEMNWEKTTLRDSFASQIEALQSLTATTDYAISQELFKNGVKALPGGYSSRNANVAVQTLADVAPSDSTEARLCMQEMALYAQGMRQLSKAGSAELLEHAEFHMRSATKLLRLHNETVEARNRHKRGGEQRVVVQHVQVNQGGQAVVNGSFETGGGK